MKTIVAKDNEEVYVRWWGRWYFVSGPDFYRVNIRRPNRNGKVG